MLLLAGAFGLLFGSFLNVCIRRLPEDLSVIHPRSHCMVCGKQIRWYDNIPVIGYLALRGRCRDCSTRFSPVYPLVELLTGGWFAFAALPAARLAASWTDADALLPALVHSTSMAVFGFLLIGLFFMDLRSGLLPNEFTLGGLALGLFFTGAESFWVPSVRYKTFFTPEEVYFGRHLAAAFAGYFVLKAIGWLYSLVRRQKGVGAGDAKQLAMMGAFLGLQSLALAFFVALLTCTVFAILVLARGKANGKTPLPFGSFLSVGGITAAIAGKPIVHWYAGLFR